MNEELGRFGPIFPIDLVGEADFVLGASRVSPSRREVSRGGLHETLEPRIMQVLVALYQADGKVVSRDELIARCWEGRVVGEDAITRAIGRLRRLSEADDGASFVIETIPKIGFRLMAASGESQSQPAERAGPAPSGDQPPGQPPVAPLSLQRWLYKRRLAVGAAVLLMAGAGAIWLLWPARHWTVESSRPFISTLALEGEPAFSPNGAMLAYTSGPNLVRRKIYVRNLAGGDGIKVTNDTYDDVSPSWSSDGARIAYILQKAGEPCRIMVATVPAGEAREAGRCGQAESSSVAWQPGTQFLYYRDRMGMNGEAIIRLDLDTGARLLIALKNTEILPDLRCSPDGRWLVYFYADRFDTERVILRDLASGAEKSLGEITETSSESWSATAAWSEDSRTVFVSDSSGIGSQITAYPLDGGMPYSVYTTAVTVRHFTTSGGMLAVESDTRRTNLARASPAPAAAPDILDPANGMTWAPTFAPDGTLAFLSNRSGTNAIWIMKPGAPPVLLFDAGFSSLFRLQFSPDGARLAAVTAAAHAGNVKILTADGAGVSSFALSGIGYGNPTWTPDSKALILLDLDILRVTRVDAADPSRRSKAAELGWDGVTISDDGTFAARYDKAGVWRIDGGTKLVSAKYPSRFNPPIVFRGDDLLIPDFYAAGGPRILAQPRAGGPDRVLAYAPGAEDRSAQSKMTVNPKTGEIIYVASVQRDTNIDLLTLAKR